MCICWIDLTWKDRITVEMMWKHSFQIELISVKPIFARELLKAKYVVHEANSVTMSCRAKASPALNIGWNVPNKMDRRYIVTSRTIHRDDQYFIIESNLTISVVNQSDMGIYRCYANNTLVTVYSDWAKLIVLCK